ncbi:hypothetical protein RIF29_32317 [Crotalaria pallida]|uniref:Uncharacterized protein n=1 Tax=Crotalaria pallida TaxID=3830 RepID=A0AAN9I2D1_CROPI
MGYSYSIILRVYGNVHLKTTTDIVYARWRHFSSTPCFWIFSLSLSLSLSFFLSLSTPFLSAKSALSYTTTGFFLSLSLSSCTLTSPATYNISSFIIFFRSIFYFGFSYC